MGGPAGPPETPDRRARGDGREDRGDHVFDEFLGLVEAKRHDEIAALLGDESAVGCRDLRARMEEIWRRSREAEERGRAGEGFGMTGDEATLPENTGGVGGREPPHDVVSITDRYDLRQEVGRGGMGVVLNAWDRHLDREIAVKRLRPDAVGGPRTAARRAATLRRFVEEARVTARLEHPGVVPVHDLALDGDGRAYFAMRLVRGEDLSSVFARARDAEDGEWNFSRAVGVLVRAVQAVAFAHEAGVVHRDLKPANVMVGRFGEVYVMDWGLAKVRDREDLFDLRLTGESPRGRGPEDTDDREKSDTDATLMTADGTVLGTPAFMPPEQACGWSDDIDARSDVYSLGAILYHLLTGRAPYSTPGKRISTAAVLRRVVSGPPTPVSELAPDAPPELVSICEKAMARRPRDRYAGSVELAEDLQAWLDLRAVKAHATGPVVELVKWTRRNRVAALAAATTALALIAGVVAVIVVQMRANEALTEEHNKLSAANLEILRLADLKRLEDAIERAETLWPCEPERAPRMRRWLEENRPLLGRLDSHRRSLADLEAMERDTPELAWRFETLGDLVARLERFSTRGLPLGADAPDGVFHSVERRLRFAEDIDRRSLTEPRARWDEALASIADATECPAYGGLRIETQRGLVPLGRDPGSGLWEFVHLLSGDVPKRDGAGRLVPTESMGIVLVLVPGGVLRVRTSDGKRRDIRLDPFLLSKYELTQAQWQRFTGRNRSSHRVGNERYGERYTLLHPLESVTWNDAARALGRLGLALPTQAQWEFAGRGGTRTPWWTGDEPGSLRGAANLADEFSRRRGGIASENAHDRELDDGYVRHAPVGSFRANPFGLHDVHGNVMEFCLDSSAWPYHGIRGEDPIEDGSGLVLAREVGVRLSVGGSWFHRPHVATFSELYQYPVDLFSPSVGLRPARALEGEVELGRATPATPVDASKSTDNPEGASDEAASEQTATEKTASTGVATTAAPAPPRAYALDFEEPAQLALLELRDGNRRRSASDGVWGPVREGANHVYRQTNSELEQAVSAIDGTLGAYSLLPASFRSFVFEVDVRIDDDNDLGDAGVVFGFVDDANYWFVLLNRSGEGANLNVVVDDRKRSWPLIAGAEKPAGPLRIRDHDFHCVRIARRVDSGLIRVEVDGRPVVEVRDGTHPEGRVGVGTFNDAASFDNVRVEAVFDEPR